MAALQYADCPNYHGLILRKSHAELSRADGIIPLSKKWLMNHPGVRWNEEQKQWEFPNNSTLTFGYLASDNDVHTYQGLGFQFIGFDELTQHKEQNYQYLFSRLVRTEENMDIPLRMRCTTNPGGIGCVPFGDILTPTGWKDIKEMQIGDEVFSVAQDGKIRVSRVTNIFEYDINEPLIEINARGMYALMTKEHKIARVGGTRLDPKRKFTLCRFDELPGQATILRSVKYESDKEMKEFTFPEMPNARCDNLKTISGDDFLELLGWYLSEGSCIHRDKGVQIAQSKGEGVKRISALLDRIGVRYNYSGHQFVIYAIEWYEFFKQFGLCDQKFIPNEYKNLSSRQLSILFEALMSGDGSWINYPNSGRYYTTSRQLASDVEEIALKLGFVVRDAVRQPLAGGSINGRPIRGVRKGYEIYFKRTKSGGTEILTGNHKYAVSTTTKRRSDINNIPYNGKVYCIEVEDDHTFIIRQKGSVWVSGNSEWVHNRFINPETRPAVRKEVIRNIAEREKIDESMVSEAQIQHEMPRFIPSLLWDNPYLDQKAYVASLQRLDPVTRAQLMMGDWNIRSVGNLFRKDWFELVLPARVPFDRLRCIRYWDLAATAKKGSDWTASCKLGYDKKEGYYYILDFVLTKSVPSEVQKLFVACQKEDGPQCITVMEQEPGSGGVNNIDNYRRKVSLPGHPFYADRVTGDKESRARPVSAAAGNGLIKIVKFPKHKLWYSEVMSQLEVFPDGDHDDAVDVISGAYNFLSKHLRTQGRYIGKMTLPEVKSDPLTPAYAKKETGRSVIDMVSEGKIIDLFRKPYNDPYEN